MRVSRSHGCVTFTFDGKPSERVRSALKANGYRWSPSAGTWWSNRVSGSADLEAAIRRIWDQEAGIRRVDGPCWKCQSPEGYLRSHGAAAPVLCDECERKAREEYRRRYGAPDRSDLAYEDSCRDACGL